MEGQHGPLSMGVDERTITEVECEVLLLEKVNIEWENHLARL